MRQKTTTIAAALFLLILSATAYAASVSITANTRNDGALEITANGTNYASCDGNPNGGIAELYIEDTLYCAQYADGNSSCTTVFSNGTLSGTTTFTATATDCQGTATTTYTIALDDTPTARPTTPDAGEQTVSVSISVDVRSDGGVAATSTGSGYASCNGNPNGGVARLYIGPTLYCAQYAEGTSSCTTVFDRATLNGSHTFTATATDCQGYDQTTYTLILDNTPTITPTAPSGVVSGLFDFTADVQFAPTLSTNKGTISLYVDGGHVGGADKTCTTTSCSYDYQALTGHLYELPHGSHNFSIHANGGGVNAASPTQQFTVDNTPTVTISNPGANTSGTFNITGNAQFKTSLNSTKGTIYLYMDGSHVGGADKTCTTESCTYDYQALKGSLYEVPHGNHTVKLVANGNGVSNQAQQAFMEDNTPAVSLTVPTGTLASPTNIIGAVAFKPSLNAQKGTIQTFIDGTHISADKACMTEQCPYDYQQIKNALYGLSNGNHTVKIHAIGNGISADAQNNITVKACNLTITNFVASPPTVDAGQDTNITANITGNNGETINWTLAITGQPTTTGTGSTPAFTLNTLTPQTYNASLQTQTITNCSISAATTTNVTSNANGTPATKTFPDCETQKEAIPDKKMGSTGNIATGNLKNPITLFTVPNSKFMDKFNLTYNNRDTRSAPLGTGWTHTYNVTITPAAANTYTLSLEDGTYVTLFPTTNYHAPLYSAYPRLTTQSGGGYQLQWKNGIVYSFNTFGQLTAITDLNQNSLTFAYTDNNLTLITDPSGRTTAFTYNGNLISTITDTNSNIHTLTHTDGTLTQISSQIADLGTRTWGFTYDTSGDMLTKTSPNGHTTIYTYDSQHRIATTTDPNSQTRTITYAPSNNQAQLTEKDGGVWLYTYDHATHMITTKTDPLGNVKTLAYDSNKNIHTITDQRGNTTTYTYDSNENELTKTDPAGHATTYTYNTINKPTTITDQAGNTSTMTYDTSGNLTSLTDPMGNTTTYEYDSSGNLTTITDAMNNITTLSYDTHHYLSTVTEPTGAVITFTYDSSGNTASMTDALNKTTTYTYNGLNQITTITDPENHVTTIAYDPEGNITTNTDANGNSTSYTYNFNRQITSTTDANSQTTTYGYTGTGCQSCSGGVDKMTSVTDAKGNTTTFQYNLYGQLIKETNPLGKYKTYTYDPAGNPASMTDENGNTTTYANDNLNRLTLTTFPDNSTKTFEYDSLSRLTTAANQNISYTISYNNNGKVTNITDSLGRTITYTYDSLNRRSQTTTPDGRIITYGYDTGGRLTQLQAGVDTFGFSHDLLGRRTSLSYPNGDLASYSYNAAGNLTGINIVNSQQAIINSFVHAFDNVGNKTSTTDTAGLHSYTYDPTYQLTQATHPSPQPAEQYSYDPVGNRTSTTVNSNNELLNDNSYTYNYDFNGNLTSATEQATDITTTYGYDYENRLTSATKPNMTAQYIYDPFGNRIRKNVNGTVTQYSYDGPNIITQYNSSGTVTATYIQTLTIDDPLSITQTNFTYYYHKDSLGTVTDLTDSTGTTVQAYDYDTYGNITGMNGSITQPFTFTAREYDIETGLYYYRARYYAPFAGKFINEDPIGLAGGINKFVYVQDNPVNYRDPHGLMPWSPVGPRGCEYYKNKCSGCGSGGSDAYACAVYQCCKDFGNDATRNCIRGCLIKWDKEKCANLPEPARSKCRGQAHLYCYDRCAGHYIYFFIPPSCDSARKTIGY